MHGRPISSKNTREMTSSSLTISTLNGTITLTACSLRSISTRLPSVWISQAAIYITLPTSSLSGREITACGNIARGIKGDNYLVLETEAAGNHPWLPYPGQLRLQAISHIANGACMVEYWHWHSIHNAIESYWKGVLSHDLRPNRLYKECSVIGNELKKYGHSW